MSHKFPHGDDRNRDRGRQQGGGSSRGNFGASGSRGARGTAAVHGDGKVPAPDAAVHEMEEKSLASSLGGNLQSLTIQPKAGIPVRPAYGSRGEKIVVWANYIQLFAREPEKRFERYEISIQAADKTTNDPKSKPKGQKLGRIIELLLSELPDGTQPATDFRAVLLTTAPISPLQPKYKIKYYEEKTSDPVARGPEYHVELTWTRRLDFVEVIRYLNSTNVSEPLQIQKAEMLQALNIIIGHGLKNDSNVLAKQNKYFPPSEDPAARERDLSKALQAIRGFFMSCRPATGRLLLNIQVQNVAAWKTMPLTELLRLMRQEMSRDQISRELIGVYVAAKHLNGRPRRIAGLVRESQAAQPASNVGVSTISSSFGTPSTISFVIGDHQGTGVSAGRRVTVAQYFKDRYGLNYYESPYPVVNVGNSGRPIYLPAEVCEVTRVQTYDRKLSPNATSDMIRFAVRKAKDNADDIKTNGYNFMLERAKATLQAFKVGIEPGLVTVHARILPGFKMQFLDKAGKGTFGVDSDNGGWKMIDTKFSRSGSVGKWTVIKITTKFQPCLELSGEVLHTCVSNFTRQLCRSGLNVQNPDIAGSIAIETPQTISQQISVFFKDKIKTKFVIVLLPSDSSAIYNAVKKAGDIERGIHTLCVRTDAFVKSNTPYFANVALKFNLKSGGQNQLLKQEDLPIVSSGSTMLVGLDVTHPSPGSIAGAPSVSAIVASIDKNLAQWPADVAVQTGREEMVKGLESMFNSRLKLWQKYNSSKLPEDIIIYRDGVGEGMYDLVLQKELPLIRAACAKTYQASDTKKGLPRLSIVICGKRHHTRFYPTNSSQADIKTGGTKCGTVVDRGITETRVWDFFSQAHTALQGTPRPAHYVVIHDEVFRAHAKRNKQGNQAAADNLIKLTHALSYVYGRANKAVSLCTPAYYADLVCDRARRWLSHVFDEQVGSTSNSPTIPDMQAQTTVHENLKNTMFYI